jgi:pimeloyl-ACP methyl ester carboxylesterase
LTSVESDVLEIAYVEIGDETGPPVVLIHGWPDTARGWREVAEGLARSGWRVIAPDTRGTANTGFRSPTTPRDGQA